MNTESQQTIPGYAPTRLELKYDAGAGWKIYADIEQRISFGEFAMRPGLKPILETKYMSMAYEPWTGPFTPQAWDDMIKQTLGEMVALWNEKHGATNLSTPPPCQNTIT